MRPPPDVFATLRVQKSLLNRRLWLRGALISVLSDRDGALRPLADFRVTTTAIVSSGADPVGGSKERLIDQFRDKSRGWVHLRLSL